MCEEYNQELIQRHKNKNVVGSMVLLSMSHDLKERSMRTSSDLGSEHEVTVDKKSSAETLKPLHRITVRQGWK